LKILLVGEINLDIILQGFRSFPAPGREVLVDDFAMALGSSCAITGAGLVRLGNPAAYFGKTGDDPAGAFCRERMSALGLDVSRVKLDPALKTGVTVSFASRQDRSLVSYLGATTALTAGEIADDIFPGFDHLHSSSYFLQTGLHPGFADLYARASRHGLTTSLDPACDPSGEWKSGLDRVLPHVGVFLPNEVELEGITGEKDPIAGLRALDNGSTLTVVKRGSRGATALEKDVPVHVEAPAAEPVDLTGAGDCFNAGFLHGWLHGWDLREALRLGVACGSFSIRGLGGTGAQPTLREALDLLQTSGVETGSVNR
jgi:sugar/nucleoside kinase (ribokinase family)